MSSEQGWAEVEFGTSADPEFWRILTPRLLKRIQRFSFATSSMLSFPHQISYIDFFQLAHSNFQFHGTLPLIRFHVMLILVILSSWYFLDSYLFRNVSSVLFPILVFRHLISGILLPLLQEPPPSPHSLSPQCPIQKADVIHEHHENLHLFTLLLPLERYGKT